MKPSGILIRVVLAVAVAGGLVVWEVSRQKEERARQLALGPAKPTKLHDCTPERPERPSRTGQPGLTDVTDELGIDFQHVVGPLGTYYMPESIGAGIAIFDADGDGRMDVFFANCGRSPNAVGDFPPGTRPGSRLYRQTDSGTFIDATEGSGLSHTGYSAGCAAADVDNDGDVDLFVTNYGQDRLFLNDGSGRFVDATAATGFEENDWGVCAAFFDYDRDGWLDLVVVNYTADPVYQHSVACGFLHGQVSYCGPHKFQPTIDRLYHNDGLRTDAEGRTTVHFTDVTEAAGFDQARTYGFGAVCADFTGDDWPDVFITNDGAANRLWVNQRDGTFLEEAVARDVAFNGRGIAEAGMGVAVGDVDGNGVLDLVVTHLTTETATLYLGNETGTFMDSTALAGIDKPTSRHTGWGAALIDLNHDGALDLPVVNGLVIPCHSGFPFHGEDEFHVRRDDIPDADAYWRDYADDNLLLMGSAEGVFRSDPALGSDFCAVIASGRGLAYGDLDGDGDLDLIVGNCGQRARVYRNDLPKSGHWLQLELLDPERKRHSLGATVKVRCGGSQRFALASPYSSYLASHDPRVHFGLGETDHVDEIIVRWPDGPVEEAVEVFPGGPADRLIRIRRGEGTPLRIAP